jgi:hypothetical protein
VGASEPNEAKLDVRLSFAFLLRQTSKHQLDSIKLSLPSSILLFIYCIINTSLLVYYHHHHQRRSIPAATTDRSILFWTDCHHQPYHLAFAASCSAEPLHTTDMAHSFASAAAGVNSNANPNAPRDQASDW